MRRCAELLGEGFDLDALERDLIHAALERAGGSKTHAAFAALQAVVTAEGGGVTGAITL